jgi:predicted metal-dependent HD superfamily phosphohydrolase
VTEDLASRWPAGHDTAVRDRLLAAYDEPRRGYHDLRHLTEVLHHLDDLLAPDDPVREAVVLAAWFHDAVYDGRGDDEERSARLAEESLSDPVLRAEVSRLVRLTATHRPDAGDRAGQVLCDADLAILAADGDRYADYVAGVRAEYSHVDDATFAEGRAAVLEDLLAKPTLFATAAARERWEAPARANAEREISSLRSS